MKGAFGDESIIVLLTKTTRTVKSASDNTDRLELRSRVTDGFFVYCESLGEELVGHFLEASLISDLTTCDEQAQAKVRGPVDPGVQG